MAPGAPMADHAEGKLGRVGPVLEASEKGRAVARAIQAQNAGARVEDRGAYLRVSAEGRCVLTRRALEEAFGRPVELPADLEPLMPAFQGFLHVGAEGVEWRHTRA